MTPLKSHCPFLRMLLSKGRVRVLRKLSTDLYGLFVGFFLNVQETRKAWGAIDTCNRCGDALGAYINKEHVCKNCSRWDLL